MKLDNDDITVLLEALDAWENKDMAGEMIADLIGAMIDKDGDKIAREEKQRIQAVQRKAALQARKEQAIVLKAKLLQLRTDGLIASAEKIAGVAVHD